MRPRSRCAASSVSWGPSTLSTRSFISSAALVAASTSSPVNVAALGLLASSAPNTMIAGGGLGSGWLVLACGLGFELLVIVCCLLRIRRGPEMAPLRVRSVGWRRGRRPDLVLVSALRCSLRNRRLAAQWAVYRILYLLSSKKWRQKVAKIKAES